MNPQTVQKIIDEEISISLFDLPARIGKRISQHIQVPFSRLQPEERNQLIYLLYINGILEFKNVMYILSRCLDVSRTTLYNYSNTIANEMSESNYATD